MGKARKGKEAYASDSSKTSENSQNQGFLRLSNEKAAHGQNVQLLVKSGKGLKSGEPFSALNDTNPKA
jgi:hypothetical protein